MNNSSFFLRSIAKLFLILDVCTHATDTVLGADGGYSSILINREPIDDFYDF
jgi:hypothetical protein